MRALVLVDLQNDFFPGGALQVKEGYKILPAIRSLLNKKWDLIVASKDWHPRDHGSFAPTHRKKPGEKVMLGELEQILWPMHCVQETSGADFYPGWDVDKVEQVVYKGTDREIDSYSAFFDNGHKKSTGLGELLKKRKITDVYLAGLATDYCVKFSSLDALNLGFRVFVIEDGCRGVNLSPDDSDRALTEIRAKGGRVIQSDEVK